MRQILRTRRKGKTADAIRLCIQENAVLVTPFDPHYIEDEALKLFHTTVRVVRFKDFLNNTLEGCHHEKFVIDNVEECLQQVIKDNTLLALTMNIE